MAMPRSPRYSCAHLSKANVCESRSRGPSAWQACMYSWPSVPSGVRLLRVANQTLELPAKYRSEEHTSELQSQSNLVCRLLLEKKKKKTHIIQKDRSKIT